MCGIVGMIVHGNSGMFQKHDKMLAQLLHAGMFRGEDATGLIGILKNGDFGIMKEASDAYFFNAQFNNSKLDKELYNNGKAIIGHNRAKTIGKNVDENAHPFVEDNTFAMVHNGTLRNHKAIKDTEVDSQALTYLFKQAMDQENWKEAMEEALGKVNGAFAVVWYDQKRNELCMIRNKERPLALIKLGDTTLFCSEAPMGQWIAWRNNEKIVDTIILKEHTLYQFDLSKTGGDFSETNLSPKAPAVTSTTPSNGGTKGTAIKKNAGGNLSTDNWMLHSAGALSKNAFKKLRPKLLKQRITFELDDYFPNSPEDTDSTKAYLLGYVLDGAYDLVEYRHEVEGLVWFTHQLCEYELSISTHLTGEVVDCTYDAKAKKIVIHVDKIQLVKEEAVV